MREARVLVAVVVAFVALLSLSVAAHDEFRFVGTVVKVDTVKNRFSLKFREQGKDETVEIQLYAGSTVTRDGKNVPRTELKPGITVVVDALGDDYDSLEAVTIRIVPPVDK
jgi:methionine-rich copper-binding protein CopC